jgi:hypothetical protein
MENKQAVTVAELIEFLKALPQDMPVLTEGCDCHGPCSGASVYTKHTPPYVVLERDDAREWPKKVSK